MHDNIYTWYADVENAKLWRPALDHITFMEEETMSTTTETRHNPFYGKTVVATGKLINYTRDEIQNKLLILGAKPPAPSPKRRITSLWARMPAASSPRPSASACAPSARMSLSGCCANNLFLTNTVQLYGGRLHDKTPPHFTFREVSAWIFTSIYGKAAIRMSWNNT